MVCLMGSHQEVTLYGNLYDLFDVISLRQQYVTEMAYAVRFIDGELNMSKF